MLSLRSVVEIQELLAQGVSQRVIAIVAGVSRNTISAIAKGRHHRLHLEVVPGPPTSCPAPWRCKGCGGLVATTHCLVCALRSRVDRMAAARRFHNLWADSSRRLPRHYRRELAKWSDRSSTIAS